MAADRADSREEVNEGNAAPKTTAPVESGTPPVPPQKLSSFGLPRLYRCVDISPDTCLLPKSKLDTVNSSADGLDEETEKELRFLGCELIQSACILLKLPQVAAASGQILYTRYFYSKSFVRNNFEHVAMACVNLASKVEEAPRRFRDVINVFHHLKQKSRLRSSGSKKRPAPLILDQNYIALKNHVIKAERRVLKELGFCVHVKHPHKLIQAYIKALDQDAPDLMQKAWSYMNDGLRTDMFVRYRPETLACACIYLAARICQIPLPMDPQPWWELFDAEYDEIIDISNMLLQLYRRPKPPSWGKLDKLMNEMRQQLQVKSQSRFDAPGASANTPNPQDSNDKFSPSRPVSPSPKKERNRKERDRESDRVNGELRSRRSRSRSTPPSGQRRDLPKRYIRVNSPPSRERKRGKYSQGYDRGRGGSGGKRHRRERSPPTPGPFGPHVKTRPQPRYDSDQSFGKKPKKHHRREREELSRSRSRSRERSSKIASTKEREREVRKALGKRQRSPVSPDKDEIVSEKKSSKSRK